MNEAENMTASKERSKPQFECKRDACIEGGKKNEGERMVPCAYFKKKKCQRLVPWAAKKLQKVMRKASNKRGFSKMIVTRQIEMQKITNNNRKQAESKKGGRG